MRVALSPPFALLSLIPFFVTSVSAATSYANQFVEPDVFLAGGWNASMVPAQNTVIAWARELAAQGPWSVTTKQANPPSGDKHDYMSWAPYWHPDCSNVGNTTALPQEEVWSKCQYKPRDGIFNPDRTLVTDSAGFQTMSDAVFYNAVSFAITRKTAATASSEFSKNAVKFIQTWFIDEATRMKPNLDYAQMQRGPDGQIGSHTGVLDLKNMAKIASAVLLMRKAPSPDWTTDIDTQFVAWCNEYIKWLTTARIAIEEKEALNNHGSFYFNQLAALQIIANDNEGAKTTINEFFDGIYMGQIDPNGDQPLESARTRPYHYLCYNLAAMITNARLLTYADPASESIWEKKTTKGGTIKLALDYAMSLPVPENEAAYAPELFPNVALVAAKYGDEGTGEYAAFLKRSEANYSSEPWFLWSQPLWDSRDAKEVEASASGQPQPGAPSPTGSSNEGGDNAALATHLSRGLVGLGLVVAVTGIIMG